MADTAHEVAELMAAEIGSYLPGEVAVAWDERLFIFDCFHGPARLGRISGELMRLEGVIRPEKNIFVLAALQVAGCRSETELRLSERGEELCDIIAKRSALYGVTVHDEGGGGRRMGSRGSTRMGADRNGG